MRKRVLVDHDAGFGLHLQVLGDGAIEEARSDADVTGLAGGDRMIGIGVEGDGEALRNKVFDVEMQLAACGVFTLNLQAGAPNPARRTCGEVNVFGHFAPWGRIEGQPGKLKPRGAANDQGALALRHRHRGMITQQAHQMDGFIRAVDSPIRIKKSVDGVGSVRRRPSCHILLRQPQRGAFQIDKGKIVVRAIGHDPRRPCTALTFQKRLWEPGPAIGVTLSRAEIFAILGHQGKAHIGHGSGGFERLHRDVERVSTGIGLQGHVGEEDPTGGAGRVTVFPGVGIGLFPFHA